MEMIKASHWTVRGPIETGKRVSIQSRDYLLLRTEPYTTKFGYPSELLTWQGHCVVCGNKFTFKTGRSKFFPTASCKKHRGEA